MDAFVVDVDDEGRVRLEDEEWHWPSLQERRAIIYAATQTIDELTDAIERLQRGGPRQPPRG